MPSLRPPAQHAVALCDGSNTHLPLVQEEEKEGDHEARTESLILQRGSMRHLADWFYPDGGWGWRVVFAAALIQILVLGPVLGGGQVLFLLT